jgi:hypothetical protein
MMRHDLLPLAAALLVAAPIAAQGTSRAAWVPQSAAIAADSACPAATYAACAVRAETRLLGGTRIVRGPEGETVGRLRGFGGANLARLLAGSDSAVAHARRYTTASRTSSAFALVGGALFVAAAAVDLEDRKVKDSGLVLVGAGSVAGLVATAYQLRAQRSLSRAVWWYNRDLVAR